MPAVPKATRNRPSKLDPETLERLRNDLVRFLTRRTGGDAALAEDLAQESLVHILRGLPQFRGGATLRTWARRIAVNVWRDHMRRQAASPVERAAAGDAFSVSAILDALTPAKTAFDPELTPDQKATQNCLFDAVRQLPVDRRRVVLLHDFAEMPLDEVAKALDCSVGAAKVRLHRARRQLAEICRAECECDSGPEGTLLCSHKVSSRRSTDTALARGPARKETR
ncbi:MAG: RNA polymerase sigma factor [Candidatus Binatia bacterium]|jgi:RNA polymerase sigma-70 factor, ECF subfamily